MAQAIPTYTISIFKLPDTLCDEMTSMVQAFGGVNPMGEIKWYGLGFRNLKAFNLALLAKQG